MKKNKLATFLFSLVPGAGEMYYGMYKSGCSIMGLFMGIAALALFVQLEELLFSLPVVWFYSFCHVHNLKHMSAEAFEQEKDEMLFGQWLNQISIKKTSAQANKMIAVFLIAIGGILVWTNLCDLLDVFPIHYEFVYFIKYRFPQLVLGVLIVLAGIWLIRGKKAELDQEEAEDLEDCIIEHEFFPGDNTSRYSEYVQNSAAKEASAEEKSIPASEKRTAQSIQPSAAESCMTVHEQTLSAEEQVAENVQRDVTETLSADREVQI